MDTEIRKMVMRLLVAPVSLAVMILLLAAKMDVWALVRWARL